MAGGRKYSAKQIRFALQCILAEFSRKEAVEMYKMRFGVSEWGIPQLKYMRTIYGDHPDFGCTLINRTEMSEAEKSALRNRLAAEARLGPNQVDTDSVAELMSPKVGGHRNVRQQQSRNSTFKAQSSTPIAQRPNGEAFSNP